MLCLRGTAVFRALAGHVPEDDLWLSSHQGGHRFAANVLVLPSGMQLGRLDPKTPFPSRSARWREESSSRLSGAGVLRGAGAGGRARGAASLGARRRGGSPAGRGRWVGCPFPGPSGREHSATVEEIVGPACRPAAAPSPSRNGFTALGSCSEASRPLRAKPVGAIGDPDHVLAELLGRVADRDERAEHDAYPAPGGE